LSKVEFKQLCAEIQDFHSCPVWRDLFAAESSNKKIPTFCNAGIRVLQGGYGVGVAVGVTVGTGVGTGVAILMGTSNVQPG